MGEEGNSHGDMARSLRLNSILWDDRKPEELKHVQVVLEGSDLWRKFHEVSTEMIITKTGRNMFPVLTVKVSGLEPDARYYIAMEMCLASDSRYKFVGDGWKVAGKAEQQLPTNSRMYIHQESPATGAHWMRDSIKMKAAKLTNNPMNSSGHIILTSMHKYIPYIHVIKTSDIMNLPWSPTATFSFPETEFIAVTAYQNDEVTKLKINNNPFAKGFRENGLSYVKRKQSESENRKRHCSENSYSPVHSVQSPSPAAEDCDSIEKSENCEKHCDHNKNSVVPVTGSHCEELTAITNISINTNTIQYPYSRLYPPLYPPLHHQDQPLWRLPLLLPPPPPPLLPHCFLPFPYNPSLIFHPPLHHFSHHGFPDYNLQPYDYSTRDKSS